MVFTKERMAPLDLLKTVLGKLRQFQLVSGLKHTLQLHPSQSVHIRAARTPLLLAPPDMPAQHRRHNHSVVAGGNRSAAENANRPATADVITRRGLGTTLDSHRTLELGSHFRHSMSAIIGHCPRTAVAERTAACM